MNYTEKEKKGIDRVEGMNRFFDKVLMPAVGVLVIITLLAFTVGRLMEKLGGGEETTAPTTVSQRSAPQVFAARAALLAEYETYARTFEAYGYAPAEGYSQDLALCKTVDDELLIYQFDDKTLGNFTILRYTPSEGKGRYDSLSLTISSAELINATVTDGDGKWTVTFTSPDFSSYQPEDKDVYARLLGKVSLDELRAMYGIFETDIENLAEACGIPDGAGQD